MKNTVWRQCGCSHVIPENVNESYGMEYFIRLKLNMFATSYKASMSRVVSLLLTTKIFISHCVLFKNTHLF